VASALFSGTEAPPKPDYRRGRLIRRDINCQRGLFPRNHKKCHNKQLIRDLVFAANIMQIKVLNHVIIGDNCYFSFADEGFIEKYDPDFLSLRK
jgi:hypothetical protein